MRTHPGHSIFFFGGGGDSLRFFVTQFSCADGHGKICIAAVIPTIDVSIDFKSHLMNSTY